MSRHTKRSDLTEADIRSRRMLFVGDYVRTFDGTEGEVIDIRREHPPVCIQVWEDGEPTTKTVHIRGTGARVHKHGRLETAVDEPGYE